jgi:ferric-dicitrate binding protein FerR (iron transport regulator)
VPLKRNFSLARVAASIALLAALGIVVKMLFTGGGPAPVVIVAGAKASEQKLPDGSKVFMNKNAEISYVAEKGKRGVKLKGEAYFEVVHNQEQPFVVEVDGLFIKDIGTAFNVKALPGGETVEVLVEEGEVQFYTDASNSINLVKGEKAIYNKTTKAFTKQNVPATDNSVSYKSKVFHFSNVSLKEVVEQVNEVYGSDIRLDNEGLGNCRLSVEFNNEEMDVLLGIIAETLDLNIEKKGNSVVLKGEACP